MRYTSVYRSGSESWTWYDAPLSANHTPVFRMTRHHTHNIVTAVPSGRLPQGKPTSPFVAIHGLGFRRVYIETLACSVSGCRRRIPYSRPFHRFIPQSIIEPASIISNPSLQLNTVQSHLPCICPNHLSLSYLQSQVVQRERARECLNIRCGVRSIVSDPHFDSPAIP